MKENVFIPYNAFSVGETPGTGMEMSKLLTADYRNELDMVFSFDHLKLQGIPVLMIINMTLII